MKLENCLALGFANGARNIDEAQLLFLMSEKENLRSDKVKKFSEDFKKYKNKEMKIDEEGIFNLALEIKKNRGDFE